MTLRLQRLGLRLVIVTLVAVAGVFSWLAVRAATSAETEAVEATPISPTERNAGTTVVAQRIDPQSKSWSLPLQRPLYDPPPPPPKVVKKELPPIRAKLLGTVIEPGASRAMIQLPGGKVEFRGQGEPLGPQDPEAVIETIGPQSIRVARGEEKTELTIERGY